jgi:Holliday junction DNA helicase RuvA
VGYEVFIPDTVLNRLPSPGDELKLYIFHQIKEDDQVLYGFLSLEDRSIFMTLTSISGVGPKVGVKFLSTFTSTDIVSIIANQDVHSLTKIPGVGKKLAERIVVELKDKMSELALTQSVDVSKKYHYATIELPYLSDLYSALKILGYTQDEIKRAIDANSTTLLPDTKVEHAITHLLKTL